jgi:hypothetical protein
MKKPTKVVASAIVLATTPFTTTTTFADDPKGCAPNQIGVVQPGWDYTSGIWTTDEGEVIGWSALEDECINPITDDLFTPTTTTTTASTTTTTTSQPPQVTTSVAPTTVTHHVHDHEHHMSAQPQTEPQAEPQELPTTR